VFEVEFSRGDERTYGELAPDADVLLLLQHRPVAVA